MLTDPPTVIVRIGKTAEPEAPVHPSFPGNDRIHRVEAPGPVVPLPVTRREDPAPTASLPTRSVNPFAPSKPTETGLALAASHASPVNQVARATAVLKQAGNPHHLPAMQVLIEFAPESVESACLELAAHANTPRSRSVVLSVVRQLARSPETLSSQALTAIYEISEPADRRVIAQAQRRRSNDTLLQRFMAEQRESLESRWHDERLAATREIASYGNLAHVACLEPLFQDPDEEIRQAAMSCLLRFSARQEHDEQLLRVLCSDPSAHIRERARQLMTELEARRQRARAS